ncbi:uncharacterized protein BJ171DRAFT_149804 [Polychytrium aggregatum]|uniref:uncharacterized protein n=1 Tax=Polychytrium aggregatum TaxID=110093 RepID=UPI0022FE5D4D|nr:uncharacterized protein BJ171DRAFT_149804 [Polychytrium aggregatum]KAI9203317.1 hypothetical protein BJ171DRAFT_149804 [Polychytrium aggregatum]
MSSGLPSTPSTPLTLGSLPLSLPASPPLSSPGLDPARPSSCPPALPSTTLPLLSMLLPLVPPLSPPTTAVASPASPLALSPTASALSVPLLSLLAQQPKLPVSSPVSPQPSPPAAPASAPAASVESLFKAQFDAFLRLAAASALSKPPADPSKPQKPPSAVPLTFPALTHPSLLLAATAAVAALPRRSPAPGAGPAVEMAAPLINGSPVLLNPALMATSFPLFSTANLPLSSSPYSTDARKRRNSREGKLFSCDVAGCDKQFTQLAHLKIHKRKHSGERPYLCSFPDCGKSFTQLGNLKTHERIHSGEKPFKCSFPGCGKTFSQMGNMKTHQVLHMGAKPYTCRFSGCAKSFSQMGNLKAHEQKVHIEANAIERQSENNCQFDCERDADCGAPKAKKRRTAKAARAVFKDLDDASSVDEEDDGAETGQKRSRGRQTSSPNVCKKEILLLQKMKAVLER